MTRAFSNTLGSDKKGTKVHRECFHMKLVWYRRFYYYHWVDISAGGLLVPYGIIHPVVSVSALTCLLDKFVIEIDSS